MSEPSLKAKIALVGNPNAGKTTLFNALTGQNQKVGNYAGATVSRKSGTFFTPHGHKFELIDLPGSYSLEANSPDEKITRDVLVGDQESEAKPDLVLCVLDACHLERHLYLLLQVLELGYPVIAVLNKIDSAEAQGLRIDPTALSEDFGVPFVPISATTERGLTQLKQAVRLPFPPAPGFAIVDDLYSENEDSYQKNRFEFIHRAVAAGLQRPDESALELTDRIDAQALHPIKGWLIFGGLMLAVFWSIFKFAEVPMGWVEGAFEWLGNTVSGAIGEGDFQSLLVDGVLAGVGGVLVFLPQIVLLFFFISLLESSGYMARAAYLMDGIMNKVGLSGKSFLPLLSGYACAIPGIMATRTIPNAKERLATILILPWTSCTARLPVYVLIIPLIFVGALNQGLALFGIYALGTLTALIAAKILKPRLGKTEAPQFLLELPPYQKPQWSHVFHQVWDRAFAFIKKAGTVILGLSILLWFLNTYPKSDSDDPAIQQTHSFNGQIGQALEPVVSPLGWDNRMGTAMMASFAAREVFRSSLAISYATDEEDEEGLRGQLAKSTRADGSALYTPLVGISIIVFFIYALQCLPTTVVVRRETGSWKWAIAQLVGMTLFAYLAALLVYQGGKLLGYS
ncbi:MAG: ferrous iron transport protein B [Akkermansiaceae bacterium]|jgi:ferrous iron transport protein B